MFTLPLKPIPLSSNLTIEVTKVINSLSVTESNSHLFFFIQLNLWIVLGSGDQYLHLDSLYFVP